jgi:hypothetical protein
VWTAQSTFTHVMVSCRDWAPRPAICIRFATASANKHRRHCTFVLIDWKRQHQIQMGMLCRMIYLFLGNAKYFGTRHFCYAIQGSQVFIVSVSSLSSSSPWNRALIPSVNKLGTPFIIVLGIRSFHHVPVVTRIPFFRHFESQCRGCCDGRKSRKHYSPGANCSLPQ